jgi:gamma-glutamylaminecyclotransferase
MQGTSTLIDPEVEVLKPSSAPPPPPERVFVYGTLKRGHGNYRVMQEARGRFIGEGRLEGALLFNLGPFPGVKLIEGGISSVRGEVFEVPPEGLRRLDRLEGHPTFYRRQEVEVRLSDGTSTTAWVYEYQGRVEMGDLVEDGEWGKLINNIEVTI